MESRFENEVVEPRLGCCDQWRKDHTATGWQRRLIWNRTDRRLLHCNSRCMQTQWLGGCATRHEMSMEWNGMLPFLLLVLRSSQIN